jgi:hypothetical protein
MTKQSDEETRYEQILENQYQAGYLPMNEKMRMVEEFRAARAQRSASVSAFYAAIAAAISALFAVASVIISLMALYPRSPKWNLQSL